MNNGERWKVYPLLFLTLGIAVKDKLIKEVNTDKVTCKVVNTDRVTCNMLVVTDPQGNEQALISSGPAGGILRIHGNGNNPTILLGHTEKLYGMIFVDAKGNLVSPTIAVPTAHPQHAFPGASPPGDKPASPPGDKPAPPPGDKSTSPPDDKPPPEEAPPVEPDAGPEAK